MIKKIQKSIFDSYNLKELMEGIEVVYKSQKMNGQGYTPSNNNDVKILDVLVNLKIADKDTNYRTTMYSLKKNWYEAAKKEFR